ncbi:MAG: DUF2087 domain-containing protein [Candidatus Dormibacterales bacterium]
MSDTDDPFLEGFRANPGELKVLRTFLVKGHLSALPARRGKRLVVLRWLAGHFRSAQRYSESEVNNILVRYHADTASLRRWLVDEEFMQREGGGGDYWVTGTLPATRDRARRGGRSPTTSPAGGVGEGAIRE